jgi:hypothetical protein
MPKQHATLEEKLKVMIYQSNMASKCKSYFGAFVEK